MAGVAGVGRSLDRPISISAARALSRSSNANRRSRAQLQTRIERTSPSSASHSRVRIGVVIQQAGIILGTRVTDEHDPRHTTHTAAAEMLLELAEVDEGDERVQRWVAVGQVRRERGRLRPEQVRDWSV